LLNHHVNVTFPGLENGFFPIAKKSLSLGKEKSDKLVRKQPTFEIEESKMNKSTGEFDPIKSMENEE
jgi:hypothetical protein